MLQSESLSPIMVRTHTINERTKNMVYRFLPVATTASITKHSFLSRRKIAEFFSTISRRKVQAETITKLCRYLEFDSDLGIPVVQIQRVFLLMCLKELINGGRATYLQVILTCGLAKNQPNDRLTDAWKLIHEFGGISQSEFDQRLMEFYYKTQAKNQLDKTKV